MAIQLLVLNGNFFFLTTKYYDYSVSNDGMEEKHGDDYEKDYLERETVQFIKNSTSHPLCILVRHNITTNLTTRTL